MNINLTSLEQRILLLVFDGYVIDGEPIYSDHARELCESDKTMFAAAILRLQNFKLVVSKPAVLYITGKGVSYVVRNINDLRGWE